MLPPWPHTLGGISYRWFYQNWYIMFLWPIPIHMQTPCTLFAHYYFDALENPFKSHGYGYTRVTNLQLTCTCNLLNYDPRTSGYMLKK